MMIHDALYIGIYTLPTNIHLTLIHIYANKYQKTHGHAHSKVYMPICFYFQV